MRDVYRASWTAALAASALLLFSTACVDHDHPCGSWTYVNGVCQPPPDAAADHGGADLDPADSGADGEDSGLGASCQTSAQCPGSASYCAYNPTTGVGFCTYRDCNPQGSDCPAGWTCLDGPTKYPGLGVPTMCVRQ